jgi:hypothetical protein
MRSGVVDDVAKTPASPGAGGVPRPLEPNDARDEEGELANGLGMLPTLPLRPEQERDDVPTVQSSAHQR